MSVAQFSYSALCLGSERRLTQYSKKLAHLIPSRRSELRSIHAHLSKVWAKLNSSPVKNYHSLTVLFRKWAAVNSHSLKVWKCVTSTPKNYVAKCKNNNILSHFWPFCWFHPCRKGQIFSDHKYAPFLENIWTLNMERSKIFLNLDTLAVKLICDPF